MENERPNLKLLSSELIPNSLVNELKSLPHKAGVNANDWDHVDPKILQLAHYLLEHCKEHMLPIIITSIIRPRIAGVSKTDIHSTGRAFDISVNGWSVQDIAFFVFKANEDLSIGAVGARSGLEKEVIWEDGKKAGQGAHLHLQVRKD